MFRISVCVDIFLGLGWTSAPVAGAAGTISKAERGAAEGFAKTATAAAYVSGEDSSSIHR